jgi:hypothetical protein
VRKQAALAERASEDLARLVALVSGDQTLTHAAAKVVERTAELLAAAKAAEDAAGQQAVALQTATRQAAGAQQALDLATAARPSAEALAALESDQLAAEHELDDARYCVKNLDQRIAAAKAMLEYRALRASDPEKADAAWEAVVERWTMAGQVAALKPLTPEQLAASVMQAAGTLAPQVESVEQKLEKSPPEELKKSADAERASVQSRLRELEILNQLRGTYREFVRLYGGEVGQEFQATVNQALFFGNGTIVDGWLKPSGANLVARLQGKSLEPGALAEELYWAVFSRSATDTEKKQVAEYLAGRQNDKVPAIAEVTWALLSSTEFRFNH